MSDVGVFASIRTVTARLFATELSQVEVEPDLLYVTLPRFAHGETSSAQPVLHVLQGLRQVKELVVQTVWVLPGAVVHTPVS